MKSFIVTFNYKIRVIFHVNNEFYITKDNDILIDRGINTVFQNHLQLSEIKNMSDLVNYGNGFYNITK